MRGAHFPSPPSDGHETENANDLAASCEQLAAGFLRDGIELTHRLLDGGSSSVRGGGNGGRTERDLRLSDALNLPVAYNQLGLALRNAGSGPIATKEAFLEGLSMAPEDFALLVNCGAEHQAGETFSRSYCFFFGRVYGGIDFALNSFFLVY